MTKYQKISWFENRYRVKRLEQFREFVEKYFSNISYDFFEVQESHISRENRQKINLMLQEIQLIIACSFISDNIYYSPPPAIWGMAGNISLLPNIFNLHRFRIGKDEIFDIIDKSIWTYELNKNQALLRTINPFFWIGLLFDWILMIPFHWLAKMGFDKEEKLQTSIFTKIIKWIGALILWSITIISLTVTILKELWWLTKLKSLIISLIG